jgi:hypothetical protein
LTVIGYDGSPTQISPVYWEFLMLVSAISVYFELDLESVFGSSAGFSAYCASVCRCLLEVGASSSVRFS